MEDAYKQLEDEKSHTAITLVLLIEKTTENEN